MSKYIDADKITPIMAEYVADVFSRKEHLDNISYGYCMEIADVFRQYVERAKQEQPEVEIEKEIEEEWEKIEKDYSPSALDKSYIIVSGLIGEKQFSRIANHFYELGLNARKEDE